MARRHRAKRPLQTSVPARVEDAERFRRHCEEQGLRQYAAFGMMVRAWLGPEPGEPARDPQAANAT